MATGKSAPAASFWVPCSKCGVNAKPSPSKTDKASKKVFHDACRPKGFVAKGKSIKVVGYRQVGWGDSETSTPAERKRAKAKKSA